MKASKIRSLSVAHRAIVATLVSLALMLGITTNAAADETTESPTQAPTVEPSEKPDPVARPTITLEPAQRLGLGRTATLVGTLDLPGPVAVWGEVWRTDVDRWSRTAPVRTAADGSYRIDVNWKSMEEGTYRWRVVGEGPDGLVATDEVALDRIARPVQTSDTLAGLRSELTGSFQTNARVTVWGEVYRTDVQRWSRTLPVSSTASGSFSVPLTFQSMTPGTQRWRAVAEHADGTVEYTAESKLTRSRVATISSNSPRPINTSGSLTGTFRTTKPIVVWGEVWSAELNRWSRTAPVTTSATGAYTIPLTYRANRSGTLRWRVGTSHPTGVEYTDEVRFVRLQAATISQNGPKTVNQPGALTGRFDTATPITVWGEVWRPDVNRWSRTASVRTSATGSYSIPLTYQMNRAGDQRWRVAGQRADGSVEYTSQVTFTRNNLPPGVDKRCMTGRVLCASKTTKKILWMIDGKVIETMDARYGRPGLDTREGTFQVFRKSRHHVSGIYGTAMPWAMFFSGGQAVHYSADFARRGHVGGSAGCINVRDAAAIDRVYSQVRIGDKVVVYR